MAKKKIAILGGGMAALATAYQLTKTPALRALHDVTIYQMGWRLGGKAASGRDDRGRNLEHGLHVWFGYYENSFRMLQEVYAARRPPDDCPLKTWTDAFKPQNHTGIGMEVDGRWLHLPVDWPPTGGFPGDGRRTSSLWGSITLLIGWIRNLVHRSGPPAHDVAVEIDPWAFHSASFGQAIRSGLHPASEEQATAEALAATPNLSVSGALEAAHLWALSLAGDPRGLGDAHLEAIVRLLEASDRAYRSRPGFVSSTPAARMIGEVLNVFAATVRGALTDLIAPDQPFEAIDAEDFRRWLLRHGADRRIVRESSIVRILYDISFQYRDGDPNQPTCAAGSGLGSVIRMLTTYKGAMMYLVQAGFGETVVAPLYRALVEAGVAFRFFHKVSGLELSEDGSRVERVRLDVQAKTADGKAYAPTRILGGLEVWPSEPFWGQLQDGDKMQAAGVDFESHWCAWPPAGVECLTHAKQYDFLVLAIAMGAYKPLGQDPGICAQLVAKGGVFADFVNKIDIVPTLGVQLWSDRTLKELGWASGKSATVSGPQPLDIWADMSQVLAVEPPGSAKSLHYLCGSYPTRLYREPASNAQVPAQARAEIRGLTLKWLKKSAYALWPAASDGVNFRWEVLTDPGGGAGEARLDAQFLRANIDPTECCVACGAGTTRYRLRPDQTGFANLILAGEGARHGLNATAVEAAVMSGMAASRAICGEPRAIAGYDFLTRKPSESI